MESRELAVKELEFAGLAREARIRELEKDPPKRMSGGDSDDDLKLIRGSSRFRTRAQASWHLKVRADRGLDVPRTSTRLPRRSKRSPSASGATD
jgi:hypothetical protein